jgi:type IV pilus assembly protein PilC
MRPVSTQYTLANQIELFTQLEQMLGSNLPLLETLELVQKASTSAATAAACGALQQSISNGQTLGEALSGMPKLFGPTIGPLLMAGETAGTVGTILQSWVLQLQNKKAQRQRVLRAAAYPISILALAIIIATGLLVWVVPQFELLFVSLHSPLPVVTQWVLELSKMIRNHGTNLLMLFAVMLAPLVIFRHQWPTALAQKFDSVTNQMPVLGYIRRQVHWARFAQQLGLLLQGGLHLMTALHLLVDSQSQRPNRVLIEQITERVHGGLTLAQALKLDSSIDARLAQWAHVGERTGTLDKRLAQAGKLMEEDVNIRLEKMSQLLEPFMMVGVGILVGTLMIALYLPMFQLTALPM